MGSSLVQCLNFEKVAFFYLKVDEKREVAPLNWNPHHSSAGKRCARLCRGSLERPCVVIQEKVDGRVSHRQSVSLHRS